MRDVVQPEPRADRRLIRCAGCAHILGAVVAGHVCISLGVRNGRRREIVGDLAFLASMTCEQCGAVWRPEASTAPAPAQECIGV